MSNPYAPPAAVLEDIPVVTASPNLAERLTRFFSSLVDGIAFAVLVYVPLFFGIFAGRGSDDTAMGIGALGAFLGFLVCLGLTIKFVYDNGQSIGKKLLGIKVVRVDGSRASAARIIFLRNGVVGLIGAIPYIGMIFSFVDALFIFSDDRRCLHDRIADTIVVQA